MDKELRQDSCWVRGAVIGRGSYGTVSLAVKPTAAGDGVVFAVKSVDTSSCLPSQVEALENEIEILRSLSSPYVVRYLGDDVTVEAEAAFRNLHMEYLSGGCVADAARTRQRRMIFGAEEEEKMIRDYAFCVVSGLRYLHSQGIVHCDVKADNVLVGPMPGAAKLADFGSAAALAMPESSRRRGNSGIVPRGSPLWMAPEVIRGEYQGPESDVWSLGCTVIEMATGKPAWEDRGAAETICRIGYSDDLPRIPPQLSELGRDFVEHCLRRDFSQRWSCDRLLQHPFISKCAPQPPAESAAAYSSPRCVFDWFTSDSDEEEEYEERETIRNSENLKDRIGKLASGGGAVWESDGWITVRALPEEEVSLSSLSVSDTGCCGGNEYDDGQREGTNWGYRGVEGAELEVGCDYSIGISESSKSTSEECLVDSLKCGGVVAEVRNDPNRHERDGVVTGTDDDPVSDGVDEFEDAHSRCTRSHSLQLLNWLLIFYRCRQLLDFDAYMKLFYYIFILMIIFLFVDNVYRILSFVFLLGTLITPSKFKLSWR